jgi:catechol 2,3-dioxygenase-like lactoylglutathione lyase family enzyme
VAEWLKAHAWKVCLRQKRNAGSNPALSAIHHFPLIYTDARPSGELMFDHVKFGVSDYTASRAFYLEALKSIGVAVVAEGSPTYGIEMSPDGKASLCLFQTEEKPAHLHLAFTAENRQQVEAFHHAALQAGGKDNGAPGLRPRYHANYYAAFVIDPDGHNIEVVCHKPEA